MRKVLVIGYGNPLRGDDGVGFRAAEDLRSSPIEAIACHQLLPELAEPVSRCDFVVFIDACCDNSPGRIVSLPVTPDRASRDDSGFSHRLKPAALLASAERLFGRFPDAVLLTVSGGFFGYGEGFSPGVKAAYPALLERVRQVCGIGPLEDVSGPSAPRGVPSSVRNFS